VVVKHRFIDAERWASGAADSRSGAKAIGSRLHVVVRLGLSPTTAATP
jgi:hypothetical protein